MGKNNLIILYYIMKHKCYDYKLSAVKNYFHYAHGIKEDMTYKQKRM